MEKLKFRLVIAYDGTNYEGWQVQKIGTGVQQIVETALAKLFPSAPRLHSSSRTDTGVHALGMVAHFEIPSDEVQNAGRKLVLAHQRLAAGGRARGVRSAARRENFTRNLTPAGNSIVISSGTTRR